MKGFRISRINMKYIHYGSFEFEMNAKTSILNISLCILQSCSLTTSVTAMSLINTTKLPSTKCF